MSAAHTEVHDHHHDHRPTGIMRWLTTTNHKDIGTMYLIFSLTMFFVGGIMALAIRAELFQPGLQVVNPEFFNSLTTMHALIMIFGAIMPGFVGFANWLIPMMIGAPDMALPRMNNWSFWILPFAFTLLLGSLFHRGWRSCIWLDPIRTAVNSGRGWCGHDHTVNSHDGNVVSTGSYKHHRHNHEHARTWNGADETATFRMDLADYRLSAHRSDASAGRSCDHAVD